MAQILLIFSEPDVPFLRYRVGYREVGQNDYQYKTIDGPPPLVIQDVPANKNWEGTLETLCGFFDKSPVLNWQINDTPVPTVRISSSMGNMILESLIGIVGFTLDQPMGAGGVQEGFHTGFTGAIGFTISGNLPPQINPSNISLRVNGQYVDCVRITGATSGAFGYRSFLQTDNIAVELNTGDCGS